MKITLFFFIALVIISCNMKSQNTSPKLTGKYAACGFKVLDTSKFKEVVSTIASSNYAFNFVSNTDLKISSELGMKYFSDTTFKYELSNNILTLNGKKDTLKLSYRLGLDILNLCVNKNGLDTLQLMPLKQ